MIEARSSRSSAAKAHESAFSGLDEGSVERLPRQVELLHHLAVHLQPALGDHSPRIARRADLQVLDRSVRDVTGAFYKVQVMIRDGDVGRWPGYDAMSYPLLAPSEQAEAARAAIIAADAATSDSAPPAGPKPGWEPPPPPDRG